MDALSARPLPSLSEPERAAFFAWIRSLTPEEDREDGPGFADWLRHHEALPGDTVWAFFAGRDGVLLGTASLVTQDRELAAPPGGLVLGGVNVVRERRGQGVGSAILAWLDTELNRRAKLQGEPLRVALQAENPAAIRLYRRVGFHEDPAQSGVYTKTYSPVL